MKSRLDDTGPDPGLAEHANIAKSFDTAESVKSCLIRRTQLHLDRTCLNNQQMEGTPEPP